jgi:hypothetical protein
MLIGPAFRVCDVGTNEESHECMTEMILAILCATATNQKILRFSLPRTSEIRTIGTLEPLNDGRFKTSNL